MHMRRRGRVHAPEPPTPFQVAYAEFEAARRQFRQELDRVARGIAELQADIAQLKAEWEMCTLCRAGEGCNAPIGGGDGVTSGSYRQGSLSGKGYGPFAEVAQDGQLGAVGKNDAPPMISS